MSALPDPSLAALLADVTAQKPLALAHLYRAVSGRLYALALGVTRQVPHAEAVIEQTFIRLWRGLDRYPDDGEPPLVWLGRLVRARALAEIEGSGPPPVDSDLPDWSEILFPPDRPALRPIVWLPPDQRRALLMAYGLGAHYDELADELGRSIEDTQATMRRALLTLVQGLDGDKDGEA